MFVYETNLKLHQFDVGNHQGGAMTKESRAAVQVAEALNEEKNDVW